MNLCRLGQLIDLLQFRIEDFHDAKPVGVSESTVVLIEGSMAQGNRTRVRGYLAEIIIDERISVILTGPDDTLNIEEITIPERRFLLEFYINSNGEKKIRFLEFNGTPL